MSFLPAGAPSHHHLQMEGAIGRPKVCLVAQGTACFSGCNSALGQAPSEISSRRSGLVFLMSAVIVVISWPQGVTIT